MPFEVPQHPAFRQAHVMCQPYLKDLRDLLRVRLKCTVVSQGGHGQLGGVAALSIASFGLCLGWRGL